jgi:hypothetical protein
MLAHFRQRIMTLPGSYNDDASYHQVQLKLARLCFGGAGKCYRGQSS